MCGCGCDLAMAIADQALAQSRPREVSRESGPAPLARGGAILAAVLRRLGVRIGSGTAMTRSVTS
jgi:hypothetical protein